MDLNKILESIKSKATPVKKISFEEWGLNIELGTLTCLEEVKILESLKDLGDSEYLEAMKRYSLAFSIKKIDDIDLDVEDVQFEENGESKTVSKFIYMKKYLSEWPSVLLNSIYEAYMDMVLGVEDNIKKNIKFDKFILSEVPTEPERQKLYKVLDDDTEEGLTEVEKQQKRVNKEIANADLKMAQEIAKKEKEEAERKRNENR